jgi:hypothetical protein
MIGCNTPRVVNVSTNSDLEKPQILNISFELEGDIRKNYDVKMSIIDNVTKREEIISDNEISPIPKNLTPSNLNYRFNYVYNSKKFDFTKNIYSIKLIPVKSNSIVLSNQYKFILNIGTILDEKPNVYYKRNGNNYRTRKLMWEREEYRFITPFTIGLGLISKNKKHIYSVNYIQKPFFSDSVSEESPSSYYGYSNYINDRDFICLGVGEQVFDNFYMGINLGISTFNRTLLVEKYEGSNLEEKIEMRARASSVEAGFFASYIYKNFNCQLNLSGFTWSDGGNIFKREINPSVGNKFYIYPTISFGIGYNFKL